MLFAKVTDFFSYPLFGLLSLCSLISLFWRQLISVASGTQPSTGETSLFGLPFSESTLVNNFPGGAKAVTISTDPQTVLVAANFGVLEPFDVDYWKMVIPARTTIEIRQGNFYISSGYGAGCLSDTALGFKIELSYSDKVKPISVSSCMVRYFLFGSNFYY